MDRIKFYGDADMSTGRPLQQAEQKLLALLSNPSCEDVNEALEFANICLPTTVRPCTSR